jgi:hypothetical protein
MPLESPRLPLEESEVKTPFSQVVTHGLEVERIT